MRKIVVVSSDNNPDYLFYAPYQEQAWNKLGWTFCVMITHDVNPMDLRLKNPESIIIRLPELPELRPQSVAQAGRLYAANWLRDDDLIMTCDMDLIPLRDYWHPDINDITVYGHDLTDFSYIPMGYVAMSGANWKKYMDLHGLTETELIRDCKTRNLAYSDKWEDWWNTDWQILTDKLIPHKPNIKFINRGRRLTGIYAYGRVDRGDGCKIPPNEDLIDFHAENNNVKHPVKLEPFLAVYNRFYDSIDSI